MAPGGNLGAVLVAASSAADGHILAWDLNSGAVLARYQGNASPRNAVCALGSDYLAAAQIGKGAVHFWAWRKEGSPLHRAFAMEPLAALAASPSGVVAVGGGTSGALYAWETASGRLLRHWPAGYKSVTALAFSDDGSLLFSGSEDTAVACWSLLELLDEAAAATGGSNTEAVPAPVFARSEHSLPVTALACGAGGAGALLVSASLDRTAKLWSIADGSVLATIRFPTFILCVQLDAAEQTLFAGGGDGRIFSSSLAVAAGATGIGMDASEARLAVGGGEAEACFVGHTRPVTCLALAPDGMALVSGGEDGTARLWDLRNGQALRCFTHGAKGPVSAVMVCSSQAAAGMGARGASGASASSSGRSGAPAGLTPLAPFHKYAAQATNEARPWEGAPVRLVGTLSEAEGAAACALSWDDGRAGGNPVVAAIELMEPFPAAATAAAAAGDAAAQLSALHAQLVQARAEASRWQELHTQLYEFTARKVGASAPAR